MFMVVTHDPMVVQTAFKAIDILDGVVRALTHGQSSTAHTGPKFHTTGTRL